MLIHKTIAEAVESILPQMDTPPSDICIVTSFTGKAQYRWLLEFSKLDVIEFYQTGLLPMECWHPVETEVV